MSYDLYFMKRRPDRTAADCYESLEQDFDEGAEIEPASRIEMRRVADAILALHIGVAEAANEGGIDDEPECIELNCTNPDEAPLQIEIFASSVTVAIPYWEYSEPSISTLRRCWQALFPAMTELGLVGYDPQQERPITSSTFDEMIKSVSEIRQRIGGEIGKRAWWKFW